MLAVTIAIGLYIWSYMLLRASSLKGGFSMSNKPELKDVHLFCSKLIIDGEEIEQPKEHNPLMLSIGSLGRAYGLGAILYAGIVYMHPELTQMQLLIAKWPMFLSGLICTLGGYAILISQLEHK